MNMSPVDPQRPLRGLPLAVGLCLGLWILTAGQVAAQFSKLAPDWSNLAAAVDLNLWNTPLGGEIVFFVFAQMLLHLSLAVPIWLLSLVTEAAYPALRGRRNRTVIAWFGIALVWILVANATLYPWSGSGVHSWLLARPLVGSARLFEILTPALLALIGWLCLKVALGFPPMRAAMPRALAYGSVVVLIVLTVQLVRAGNTASAASGSERPNVIIVGIDSLRADAIGETRGVGFTPHLDAFLRDGAHRFSDAVTPAARTYASWMSILMGHNPRATHAREDLMPRAAIARLPTLADLMRASGYRTTFATDDVRFSNIDESYGFDRVISPTIGVADFLLGKANDLPLTNLVSNTLLARWLFPATYANRATAYAYRPETFIDWVDAEVDAMSPQFLAVHLTLSHWPFTWAEAGDSVFDRAADRQYQYVTSVIAADRQFGALMQAFESKGLLHNAIVIVLSDHGEGLGKVKVDTLLGPQLARQVLGAKMIISTAGHGTSVLSPHQYAVVLAMRGYGKAEFASTSRSHSEPVSLIDVAPTVVDLVGAKLPAEPFEGISLRPVIEADPDIASQLAVRARFTETGFRTPLMNAEKIDEARLLDKAAPFFRMRSDNARFEIRDDMLPRLIADKERAAMSAHWLLAAIPASPEATVHKYVLADRRGGFARRITSPPDARTEAEARWLWDALHSQYGSELLPPEP